MLGVVVKLLLFAFIINPNLGNFVADAWGEVCVIYSEKTQASAP